MASLHDFQMESITGEAVDLSSYAGEVCLVVNVASE
jgi:glutathione peroxidase-family protein